MVKFIFSKLLSLNYPIDVEGRYEPELFIRWGVLHRSYLNDKFCPDDNTCKTYPNITIHLPLTPINIKSYSMQTYFTDIFPTNWTLYGSIDGVDWKVLSVIDEPLCTNSYNYSTDDPKMFCNQTETKTFNISSDITNNQYFHYFRYELRKNSNHLDNGFKYSILTYGFEVSGDYLTPFQSMPHRHYSTINLNMFAIFMTYSS